MNLNFKKQDIVLTQTNKENNLYIKKYRSIGLQLNRLIENGKRPIDQQWQVVDSLKKHIFDKSHNIGLLTGVKTDEGHFSVIDIDLSRNIIHTKLLAWYILDLLKSNFGSSVRVESGGEHQGYHFWFYLDDPILEKIKISIDLSCVTNGQSCALEIMCQGSNHGFNIVAPDSNVVSPYTFFPDVNLEELEKQIIQIKKDDFLSFINGKDLDIAIKIAEFCSILHVIYKNGLIEGKAIDMCLADYLINSIKMTEEKLLHFSFNMAFGEKYSFDQTKYILSRTIERIDSGKPSIKIGSIVETIEEQTFKNAFLQSMTKLERTISRTESNNLTEPQAMFTPEILMETVVALKEPEGSMFRSEIDDYNDDGDEMLIEKIFPAKRFIMLHGDPGLGKTSASVFIADIILRLYGNYVLYFNLERKHRDIKDKKKTMSANRDKLICINPNEAFILFDKGHQEKMFEYVQAYISQLKKVDLIIIDSLMAATNGQLTDGQVGGALLFLNRLASELGCSVLLIHHNNKGGDSGRKRIFGSNLISGAVVLAYEIDRIENCEFARKLVVSKSNIRDFQIGLEMVVGQYPGKNPIIFRSENNEYVENVPSLLVDKCRNILLQQLVDCDGRDADEIRQVLGNDFSESTITRASQQLGIVKSQQEGKRIWSIPKTSLILKLYNGQ